MAAEMGRHIARSILVTHHPRSGNIIGRERPSSPKPSPPSEFYCSVCPTISRRGEEPGVEMPLPQPIDARGAGVAAPGPLILSRPAALPTHRASGASWNIIQMRGPS